jgi:hypothetical protein
VICFNNPNNNPFILLGHLTAIKNYPIEKTTTEKHSAFQFSTKKGEAPLIRFLLTQINPWANGRLNENGSATSKNWI